MQANELAKRMDEVRDDMREALCAAFPPLLARLAVRYLRGDCHRDGYDLAADVDRWAAGYGEPIDVAALIVDMRRRGLILRSAEVSLSRAGRALGNAVNLDGSIRPPSKVGTNRDEQRVAMFLVWQHLPPRERSTTERAGGVDLNATTRLDVRSLRKRGDEWRKAAPPKVAAAKQAEPGPLGARKRRPERRRKKVDPANVLRVPPGQLGRVMAATVAAEVGRLIERQKNEPTAPKPAPPAGPTADGANG
ncbi:MAG: hypothetical protein JNL96_14355 [Planctomycetaceae bacterium]|nr:hypothetical protein [Planctomycetaceae bacterium]